MLGHDVFWDPIRVVRFPADSVIFDLLRGSAAVETAVSRDAVTSLLEGLTSLLWRALPGTHARASGVAYARGQTPAGWCIARQRYAFLIRVGTCPAARPSGRGLAGLRLRLLARRHIKRCRRRVDLLVRTELIGHGPVRRWPWVWALHGVADVIALYGGSGSWSRWLRRHSLGDRHTELDRPNEPALLAREVELQLSDRVHQRLDPQLVPHLIAEQATAGS